MAEKILSAVGYADNNSCTFPSIRSIKYQKTRWKM